MVERTRYTSAVWQRAVKVQLWQVVSKITVSVIIGVQP
jgi:hypothetical protein